VEARAREGRMSKNEPLQVLAECCATCRFATFNAPNYNRRWRQYGKTHRIGVCTLGAGEIAPKEPKSPLSYIIPSLYFLKGEPLSKREYLTEVKRQIKIARNQAAALRDDDKYYERALEKAADYYDKAVACFKWWKRNKDKVRECHRTIYCHGYEPMKSQSREAVAKKILKKQ